MTQQNTLRRCNSISILIALVLGLFAATTPAQQFPLHDGDTVVFYGDSITAQRFYTKQVEEFLLTRYPALHIRFVNAGVPGDSVKGGYAGPIAERMQHDVTPFHPAMITVMLGMNDGGWAQGSPEIDAAFQTGYRALVDALHKAAPNATLTLIPPTPYDEITHGTEFPGYSRVIDQIALDVSQIGAQLQSQGNNNIVIADFHRPLVSALERAKTQFPQLAPLLVPDRIHPSETTHWIMTAALMAAWHANPIVSSLTLDAANATVTMHDRTTVTNLQRSPSGLQWTQLDQALPLPLDFNNALTPVMLAVSDVSRLDQILLQVDFLDPGQYELLIDGKSIAVFSREALHDGVNLALYKTPMLDQSRGIDWTEERRADLDQARFILSAEVKETANLPVAETTLRNAQDVLAAKIRKDLAPKPHRFELKRQ